MKKILSISLALLMVSGIGLNAFAQAGRFPAPPAIAPAAVAPVAAPVVAPDADEIAVPEAVAPE